MNGSSGYQIFLSVTASILIAEKLKDSPQSFFSGRLGLCFSSSRTQNESLVLCQNEKQTFALNHITIYSMHEKAQVKGYTMLSQCLLEKVDVCDFDTLEKLYL